MRLAFRLCLNLVLLSPLLIPLQAGERKVPGWVVRVHLNRELPAMIPGGRIIPEFRVLEETALQGALVDGAGHVASYVGSYSTELALPSVHFRIVLEDLGGRRYPAQLVGVDERLSLAVLESEHLRGSTPAIPGSWGDAEPGASVVSFLEGSWQSAAPRIVKTSRLEMPPLRELQWTLHGTRSGRCASEGGFLVGRQGRLLGILTRGEKHPFSSKIEIWQLLPAPLVFSSAEEVVRRSGSIRAGWLGVLLDSRGQRAIVDSVLPGSPAAGAGLERGDEILEVQGHALVGIGELARAVRWLGPGSKISLAVRRRGAVERLQTRLTYRQDERPRRTYRLDFPRVWRSEAATQVRVYPTLMPARLHLGLVVNRLTPQLARYFQCPRGQGLLIVQVEKDSMAEQVGLEAGDVLLRVNEQGLATVSDLDRSLRRSRDGMVLIEFVRRGKTLKRKVMLP